MIAGSNVSNMAARSLIMDLLETPNGTLYGILIAFLIIILTTGLCLPFSLIRTTIYTRELFNSVNLLSSL